MTKNNTKRQILQSRVLRFSALAALVVAEVIAAKYAGEHAADPIGAVVLIGMAVMAGLCVALGPSYLMGLRSNSKQRKFGWYVVAGALLVSCWNLSCVIDAQRVETEALAVRNDPTFAEDQTRLAALNRRIDALSDETGMYGNGDQTYANYLAERDRLQERVDRAQARPVVFASFPAWMRAFLFHGLVFGFSAAFALPASAPAAKRPAKRRGKVSKRDGNVTAVHF
jgi:hypothetical protein